MDPAYLPILILTTKQLGHHSLTLGSSVSIWDNVLGRQPPDEHVEHSSHVLGDCHSRLTACVCMEALLGSLRPKQLLVGCWSWSWRFALNGLGAGLTACFFVFESVLKVLSKKQGQTSLRVGL